MGETVAFLPEMLQIKRSIHIKKGLCVRKFVGVRYVKGRQSAYFSSFAQYYSKLRVIHGV